MRIRLRGINSKRKRLADGSFKTYYWAWKGGPPLRGEPGTPEFIASYNEAVARKVMPPSGTLFSLLQQYQGSADFRLLADLVRGVRRGNRLRRESDPSKRPILPEPFRGFRDRAVCTVSGL